MIPRDAFINKLRELNYSYKRKAKKVSIWRKRGGTHYVSLPETKLLVDDYVRSTLRQCGETEPAIEEFVSCYSSG